jgi:hypothetical protein
MSIYSSMMRMIIIRDEGENTSDGLRFGSDFDVVAMMTAEEG